MICGNCGERKLRFLVVNLVEPEALHVAEKILAENRKAIVTSWESEERSLTVENGTPSVARIATFYYPR
jgi:hypothetical protein